MPDDNRAPAGVQSRGSYLTLVEEAEYLEHLARELRRRLEEAWKSNDPAEAANDVAGVADDAINALSAALERVEAPCEWTPEDDESAQHWTTACGRAWSFIEDGPAENRMDFCMGCGRRVSTSAPAGTKGGDR